MIRRAIFLFAVAACLLSGAATAKGQDVLAAPPPEYTRRFRIEIEDGSGRPLRGVQADLSVSWGRLISAGDLISDENGLIAFDIQPVIDDPMSDLAVRDRFLVYRSAFTYRLQKDGYASRSAKVDDVQEFVALSDPLYRGMDRSPPTDPYVIYASMPTYGDYMLRPGPDPTAPLLNGQEIKPLIDALAAAGGERFKPALQSFNLTPAGTLEMGLDFLPLFDPAQIGLQAAGADILREPVKTCLTVLNQFPTVGEGLQNIEIKVNANFQYRNQPFTLPVGRTLTFRLPWAAVARLLAARSDADIPLDEIRVMLGDQALDLGPEIRPEEVQEAPGKMLTAPETADP